MYEQSARWLQEALDCSCLISHSVGKMPHILPVLTYLQGAVLPQAGLFPGEELPEVDFLLGLIYSPS